MKIAVELLAIAAGGALGALVRYAIGLLAAWFQHPFPWGTLIANFGGCVLIGLMLGAEHQQKSEIFRLSFGVGFLGALTTFSTFSAETVKNALDGHWGVATSNVVLNLTLCLSAVAVGIFLGKKFWA